MAPRPGTSVIVSVGNELLAGRVADTNAAWMSMILRAEGFPVALRLTVPDDVQEIAAAVRQALEVAPVVIVGGGIGPTGDDVTREGLAAALGVGLARDARAAELLEASLTQRGLRMPPGNDVQAMLPEGAEPIANAVGTAPGILCRPGGALLCAVPGVPAEMEAMIGQGIVPLLRAHPGRGPAPVLEMMTIAGMREAEVGGALSDLMVRDADPLVGSYPKAGRIVLTIESRAPTAKRRIGDAVRTVKARLGPAVVGPGDLRLNEVVARLLLARNLTIATAESVTGGLVAGGLVAVPGISRALVAGFVVYANRAKTDVLGVPGAILEAEGAVSEACARAMAEGARRVAGADIAVATTGIAGPDGGTESKPVGLVWFAIADAQGTVASRVVLPGDRALIRALACARAFDLMRRRLLGLP